MSMIGYLRRVDSDDVIKLKTTPSYIEQLLREPYDMLAAVRDQLRGKASARRAAMENALASAQKIRQLAARPLALRLGLLSWRGR